MRALIAVVVMVCAAFLTGCASAPSPTHGHSLTIRVSEPTMNQFYYYALAKNGELKYVAGMRAAASDPGAERPTWSGTFSEAELSALVGLIEANPHPESVQPEAEKPNYRLVLESPTDGMFGRTMLVSGPTPFLTQLQGGLTALMWSRRQNEIQPLLK